MATRDLLGPAAPQPPDLGHGPVQPALRLLHARGGLRLAAAAGHPPLRGDRPSRRRVHGTGRRPRPAHRRRAPRAPGPRPPRLDPLLEARPPRHRPDDQRGPARRAGGGPQGRGASPRHRQPRHARSRTLSRADALRRAAARSRRHRRRRRRRLRRPEDRLRRDPGRQRRRARRAARARARVGRRGPLHRVHGRRGRDAVVAGARRLPRRDPGSHRRPITARSLRSSSRARLRRNGFVCRTERPSESSLPRPRRSVGPAIAAG